MKQKISVAARHSTPKDLSRNHYTTLGFGHIYPIYAEEFCNGSKVSIRPSNFSRVAPQFLPNLGRLDMKLHAFYVPFRLIWNHFESFQMGLPSWNNKGSQVYKYVPTFNDQDLTFFFTRDVEPRLATASTSDGPVDFTILLTQNGSDVVKYYQFTPFGKYVYHVLNALGYNFTFVPYSPSGINHQMSEPMSALPLLAFFKLYLDYFIPSQLQPSSTLHSLFAWLHDIEAYTFTAWYQGTTSTTEDTLKQDFLLKIMDFLQEMYYYYQNNYFTSAWMSPNAPVPGLNNIGTTQYDRPVINSINSQSSAVSSRDTQALVNDDNGVHRPGIAGSYNAANINNMQLTADGLTFMQKFARFVKRSNFVGSRVLERILGQFGIRITDFESSMATYLGSDNAVMMQSDVTVTGSSEEAGDYVGKGWFSYDNDRNPRTFKANCDLYGMVFVTASIQTPSTFVDGIRRRNKHIQPLDFYNPDLDGSVMQAISGTELFKRNPFLLYDGFHGLDEMGLIPSQTFGYQLRYMEMKTAIDDISGDFCVPSLNKNIDNFILPRRIFDMIGVRDYVLGGGEDYNISDFAYSPSLNSGEALTPVVALKGDDMGQFNRIFRMTDGSADPIFGVFRFDVVVNNSVIPANTSAELDGKGKELEFETNGVHV